MPLFRWFRDDIVSFIVRSLEKENPPSGERCWTLTHFFSLSTIYGVIIKLRQESTIRRWELASLSVNIKSYLKLLADCW